METPVSISEVSREILRRDQSRMGEAAIVPVTSPLPMSGVMDRVRAVLHDARRRAPLLDEDASFPTADVSALARADALEAPLPTSYGGFGLGTERGGALPLMSMLREIGYASLPLGRLYEGHVNALALVTRYGSVPQLAAVAADAKRGSLFGVWNTEGRDGLRMISSASGWTLQGGKTFATGAGHLARALTTAKDDGGQLLMLLLPVDEFPQERADLNEWCAHGMRASATGSFDFSGIEVMPEQVIGANGDYHRQPLFSGGAWRFAAVQLGGIEHLLDEARLHLRRAGRMDDPHQRTRMGEAAIAAEGARLWVEQAAQRAENATSGQDDAGTVVAYVNLARSAVERAGLDVLELVHRSVGLAAFSRRHPIEKLSRDLATYLRQPAPDRALAEGGRHVLSSESCVAELWT